MESPYHRPAAWPGPSSVAPSSPAASCHQQPHTISLDLPLLPSAPCCSLSTPRIHHKQVSGALDSTVLWPCHDGASAHGAPQVRRLAQAHPQQASSVARWSSALPLHINRLSKGTCAYLQCSAIMNWARLLGGQGFIYCCLAHPYIRTLMRTLSSTPHMHIHADTCACPCLYSHMSKHPCTHTH